MKRIIKVFFFVGFILLSSCSDNTIQEVVLPEEPVAPVDPEPGDNNTLPLLSVVGRYLKNTKGEIVNLHGFTQTYSPFFNNNAWGNYDVQACLSYNKRMVDGILNAGWKFNFVRLHLDPIGVMTLLCRMCVMRDMNVSLKRVSGNIWMNYLCRWRNISFPKGCM